MNNSSLTWGHNWLFELSWFKFGTRCQLKLMYSNDLQVNVRITKNFGGGRKIFLYREFLQLDTFDILPQLICCGDFPVHWNMFSSIPGLYSVVLTTILNLCILYIVITTGMHLGNGYWIKERRGRTKSFHHCLYAKVIQQLVHLYFFIY